MSLFDTEEMDFDEWKGVIQCTATITTVINFLTGFQVSNQKLAKRAERL